MSENKVEEGVAELRLFNHSTGEYENKKIKVVNYIRGEKVNSIIPVSELSRLAFELKVEDPQFLSQTVIDDVAYYNNTNAFAVVKEPFNRVKRFLIMYTITVLTQQGIRKFYGDGSAGADNISVWGLKSYAYEIAHKRARARCLKSALGIDILSDIEINGDIDSLIEEATSSSSNYSSEDLESNNQNEMIEDLTPASDLQKVSVFDIICRNLSKDFKKPDCTLTLEEVKVFFKEVDSKIYIKMMEKYKDVNSVVFISRNDAGIFFDFITSEEAADFFIKNGNLSSSVKGKPNKSIESNI